MCQSNEIGALIEALSKAQGEMKCAVEDSKNSYFKSKYADITSVWTACRGPLSGNNLAVVQTLEPVNGELCLVSVLGHSSGQWIKSVLPIRVAKDDIQSLGAAITYSRRYSLAALVGICPEDDDGEGAMDRSPKKLEDISPVALELPSNIDPDRFEEFARISAEINKTHINMFKKHVINNLDNCLAYFYKWEKKEYPQSA